MKLISLDTSGSVVVGQVGRPKRIGSSFSIREGECVTGAVARLLELLPILGSGP